MRESSERVAQMFRELGDPASAEQYREVITLLERARQSEFHLASEDLGRLLELLQGPGEQLVLARIQAILMMAIRRGTLSAEERSAVREATIGTLADSRWLARVYGCGLARDLNDPSLVPHLLPLLQDARDEVRVQAQALLQQWGYGQEAPDGPAQRQ